MTVGLNEVLQLQNMFGATLVGGPGLLLRNDRQVTHVLWLAVPRCTLRKHSEAKSCSATLAAMVLLGFSLMAHLYDSKSTQTVSQMIGRNRMIMLVDKKILFSPPFEIVLQ